MTAKEKIAFEKGVSFAAEVADIYNSSTTHPYQLGDCIKAKLNLLDKKKVKRNRSKDRPIKKAQVDILQWCLAEVMRLPITDRTLELRDRVAARIELVQTGKVSAKYEKLVIK